MDDVIQTFKALSEEIRVRILMLLLDEEVCTCEFMEIFDMAQSKVSHHVLLLKEAGWLNDRKDGKWMYYKLNKDNFSPAQTTLWENLIAWLNEDKTVLQDRAILVKMRKRDKECCNYTL
jgi:ArsR family transcriptional regulator